MQRLEKEYDTPFDNSHPFTLCPSAYLNGIYCGLKGPSLRNCELGTTLQLYTKLLVSLFLSFSSEKKLNKCNGFLSASNDRSINSNYVYQRTYSHLPIIYNTTANYGLAIDVHLRTYPKSINYVRQKIIEGKVLFDSAIIPTFCLNFAATNHPTGNYAPSLSQIY